MKVKLGDKFSSNNFEKYISEYYKQTLYADVVIFDLEELEWISLEGITFLFAWINKIKNDTNCIVKIILPNPGLMIANGEKDTYFYRTKRKKRRRRLISLLETWCLEDFCNIDAGRDYINPPENLYTRLKRWRENIYYSDNNWSRIIPFRKFDVSKYVSVENVRNYLSNELDDIFNFEEDVNSLLNKFFINTPFKNKTISHLITTELFLNTLHHTKPTEGNKNECYFSISATNKLNEDDIRNWLYGKAVEQYMDTNSYNYYDAKKEIGNIGDVIEDLQVKKELERKIKETLPRNIKSERNPVVWEFFKENESHDKFRNISYIEFAFIDFGPGIPNTLKESYENNVNNDSVKSRLCEAHFKSTNLDSKILEYAFLLETSKNPFAENIQIQGFVPRGLYFLLDMVRLYHGLLIVRSGKGEIVFDFSKTDIIKESIRLSNLDYTFPGTMMNIILPEQSSFAVLMEPVQLPKVIAYEKAYSRYVSVLSIYNSFQRERKNDEDYESIELYNYFFRYLNDILDEEQSRNQPSIIYFDFAGAHLPFMDYKIFYFLANSPKINEYTNLILLNIANKELLEDVRNGLLDFKPSSMFRPIPCVIEEKNEVNIKWIGVKDSNDEKRLNKLLKYNEYTLPASDFNEPVDLLRGNVIKVQWVDKNKTAANIQKPSFLPILSDITYINSRLLNEKLKERILKPKEDEENILLKEDNAVYLSSGGYYLYEYVSFFDMVIDKDAKNRAYSENIAINLFNLWRVKTGEIPQEIDWILAITLSSQMLGRDVRKCYKRLMMHNENEKSPRLLNLANYNEFSNELGLEQIKPGNKILVVTDVISTGGLNERVYDSIKKKEGKVIGFFSIVDCRVPENKIEDVENEIKSVYRPEIDDITISLIDKLYIHKYKKNVKDAKKIIRINPITNAPTTMGLQHSEEIKVLYPEISSVFREINKERFLIGYFRNNNSYHTYFPNTENIFLQYSGKEFMRKLIEKVIKIEKERKNYEIDEKEKINGDELIVDYVFYPVFSGIEAFDDYHFQNYFNNKYLLSYPMARMDTPKGWRFTFPPKVLNETVKNKTVFILDDGSCSGETILQMIDSICFYEVKKIIVLSVFGRLEDFQREFYSRIKRMKVKRLKGKDKNLPENKKEPIVDTHIYFGTHLNIHHFPYEKSTPFVDDRKRLEIFNEKKGIPQLAKEYIKRRIKELEIIDVKDIDKTTKLKYHHFPIVRSDNNDSSVDIEKIFEIRNRIGKLDSYRIYEDYYKGVDYCDSADLELIIGIINHEPRVLDTIRNLVPELYQRLKECIYQIVFKEHLDLSKRQYKWDTESLIMFLFIIDYSILYDDRKLDELFQLIEKLENENNKKETFCYLSFLLWKECIEDGEKNNRNIKPVIFKIWHSYYELNQTNTTFYSLLCGITDSIGYREVGSISDAFSNLQLFYWKEGAKPGHKDLEMLINDVIPILRGSSNDKIDIQPLEIVIKNIRASLKKYVDKICENSYIEPIYKFYEDPDSIHNLINSIISIYIKIKELLKEDIITEELITLRNNLADLFDTFKIKYIDPKEDFAEMCLDFNKNPIDIWKKVIQNNSNINGYSNIDFNIQYLTDMTSLNFPINSSALELVFYNILQNTCKVATQTPIKLMYNSDRINGLQFFSISQDIDFQKELKEGKGLELIKQIVNSFGGQVVLPEANKGNQMFYHIIFPEKINNFKNI